MHREPAFIDEKLLRALFADGATLETPAMSGDPTSGYALDIPIGVPV